LLHIVFISIHRLRSNLCLGMSKLAAQLGNLQGKERKPKPQNKLNRLDGPE